jgi:hypothetical protein
VEGREGGGGGQGREMAQTMYVHMNKWINKQKTKGENNEEGGSFAKRYTGPGGYSPFKLYSDSIFLMLPVGA